MELTQLKGLVGVIDYGLGNSGSIINMLKKIGVNNLMASTPNDIEKCSHLILPGVGSYDNGVKKLKQRGLDEHILHAVNNNQTKLLGICLGMQLLLNGSEEGVLDGLGIIKGYCKKFNFENVHIKGKIRIPHMGWNEVEFNPGELLFNNYNETPKYYFVHSFHAHCLNNDNIIGKTEYGYKFNSSIRKENVWGVQFHPEKSHRFGMQLLQNFVNLPV
jgi:imidazole glycerol-phosphate synthase subunit HisH